VSDERRPEEQPAETPGLRVLGIKGLLEGEERHLDVGESIVIGRSRHVDFSMRRARKFAEREDQQELIRSKRFLSVSRRHVRIHFLHPDFVEVEDLSQNGTQVDGRTVDRVALTDLRIRPHELSLNGVEVVRLEWEASNGEP
jgi:hypothetical protein